MSKDALNLPPAIIEQLQRGLNALQRGNVEMCTMYWNTFIKILPQSEHAQFLPQVLLIMGTTFSQARLYQQALQYYQQGLSFSIELGDKTAQSTFLFNIGKLFSSAGQYQQAIEHYQQCLPIMRELGNKQAECSTLTSIGAGFQYLGQYQQALDHLKQGLAIARDMGYRNLEAGVLNNIAMVYQSLGQYQEALNHFKQCLIICGELGDARTESIIHNNIGLVYQNLSQYEKALDSYIRSLAISRATRDQFTESRTLVGIGLVFDSMGQYQKALDHYIQGLPLQQQLGDKFAEGANLTNIGRVYERWGQYEQALNYYQQSIAIKQEIGDRAGEGATSGNIGSLYLKWGQYQKASDYFKQSLVISEEIGDKKGQSEALNNIGALSLNWSKYQEAIDYYQQSLTISREIGNKKGEGLTLNNIGSVYQNWRKYQEAIDYFEQGLVIQRGISDKAGEGTILNNIGRVYLSREQYDRALDYFQQSLVISRELGDKNGASLTLNNAGSIYVIKGQYKQGLECYQQSLAISREIGNKLGVSVSLSNIGNLYFNEKQYEQALDNFQQSLILSRELGDRAEEGTTLNKIGSVYKAQNNLSEAAQYFEKSVQIKDFVAISAPSAEIRSSARKEMMDALANLIPCLLSLNKVDTALAYIEYNKGREMVIAESHKKKTIDPALTQLTDKLIKVDEKLQESTRVHNQLNKDREQQELSQGEYEEQLARLRNIEQKLGNKRKTIQQKIWQEFPTQGTALPVEPGDLISSFIEELPSNWVILDYYLVPTDYQIIIFVLQKDSPIKFYRHAVDEENVKKMLEATSKIIDSRREAQKLADLTNLEKELDGIGKEMYSFLLPQEIKDFINTTTFEQFTIIPSGFLHSLPLELIHDGEDFWGKKYAFSRAFNLQTLRAAMAAKKEGKKPSAILIGDPTAEIDNLGLENAVMEVKEIAEMLQGKGVNSKMLLQKDATESAFISALNEMPYSLVHFAGHAVFNAEQPDLSHLLLREEDEPSELYANEFPIKTILKGYPLVVLSACETGGIQTESDDEVFGLARGFIEAGATGLVISGWEIFDDSARDFYITFYSHYLDNIPLAESLRLARVHTSNKAQEGKYGAKNVSLLHWGAYRYYGLPF